MCDCKCRMARRGGVATRPDINGNPEPAWKSAPVGIRPNPYARTQEKIHE